MTAHARGARPHDPTALSEIVVRGGRIVDATGDRLADVRVRGGMIVEIGDVGATLRPEDVGAIVLDAVGCIVSPGFVDVHTHLREPGMEEAETIESGSRAAVRDSHCQIACAFVL